MIVPAAVIAVFALLRRYLPARRTPPQTPTSSHRTLEDFSGTQWAVGFSMLLVALAFAYTVHMALVAANRYFAESDGPATFQLLPSSAIWWFFPGIGALCSTWEVTLSLWSLFQDHERIARYVAWSNERTGFDSTRALRWMALLLAMPIGVATILAIPMHSSLRNRDIAVGRYARFGREHLPYSQASRLVRVDGFRDRDGKLNAHAGMIVDFKDGTRWRSADNRDFTPEPDPGLAEFLQQKTGLTLERFETEADLGAQAR